MINYLRGLFRNDRWIPASFVLFFIFLTGVEAVLITLAVGSFTGLSDPDPYQRGLTYNDTLKERKKDRELGWRISVDFDRNGDLDGEVTVVAYDRDGTPLTTATVTGTIGRPAGGHEPVAIPFGPLISGKATARVSVPTPGRWFLYIRIEDGDTKIERRREIFIENALTQNQLGRAL
ncbi:FixH family protein [Hyphomicrobium sp. D-2]|uniref:FixH family protein n=1 Tax=Hyphomicrobium sp. D-2 TaxID=3041621 RepID=UPI0024577A4A|nr:FixH family protein [Hyphomicrobium sp. D-2]MDH4982395.1 FixH family protein [Hyphomicrobium sp. D-2]